MCTIELWARSSTVCCDTSNQINIHKTIPHKWDRRVTYIHGTRITARHRQTRVPSPHPPISCPPNKKKNSKSQNNSKIESNHSRKLHHFALCHYLLANEKNVPIPHTHAFFLLREEAHTTHSNGASPSLSNSEIYHHRVIKSPPPQRRRG